ncbi:ribonuclease T2 family protein [Nitratifractor sp.]
MKIRTIFMLLLLASLGLSARFDTVAVENCPAYNDLRHSRNEGALHLREGERYRVLQAHKGQYLVRIPSTPPAQRWVDPRCLSRSDGPAKAKTTKKTAQKSRTSQTSGSDSSLVSLLVLSWHNAFCETHSNRKECRPLYRHGESRLVLHGLWPQPRSKQYCGISPDLVEKDRRKQWRALPQPPLRPELHRKLLRYMPGSLSALERHEWVKHGSCYDPDPVRYIHDALSLTEQVDRSMVGRYLRANLGRRVTLANLRKLFERSFGRGTGTKLSMECRRGLLTELRISLRGKGDDLRALLPKAPPLRGGCREGIVDAPGKFHR